MQPHVIEELRLRLDKYALQMQSLESGPIKRVERLNLVDEAKTKIEYVGGSVGTA